MQPDPGFERERRALVETLRHKGIEDERVLQAIGRVERHRFIDPAALTRAYDDEALPIGLGQTISQPFTVAYQSEWLDLQRGDRVLEIGTGSGYQAAVLVEMGAEVFSIERHAPLQVQALRVLAQLGYRLALKLGDGAEGWPEQAPFDAIVVTAAAAEVPRELLRQLREPVAGARGGRLVMPVGGADHQVMTRYTRRGADEFEIETGDTFRFVPLVSAGPSRAAQSRR